jgi:hypothetical protein
MGNKEGTQRNAWPAPRTQSGVPDGSYWLERSVEFTFSAKENPSLRPGRWHQVLKVHGFDITVHGFSFQQRGEQQCLYWQIPNIRAR